MNQWMERECVAALEETGKWNDCLRTLWAAVSKNLRRLRGLIF